MNAATARHAQLDCEALMKVINDYYKVDISKVWLHREMIGYVYIANSNIKKYVLKLYRNFHETQALQSIEIIQYLKRNDYPVVSIVPTVSGDLYIKLPTPDGECVAVLYDFIEGTEPDIKADIEIIGRQIGQLHSLMNRYPHSMIRRGKEFYIDRYIRMLRELQYSEKRIQDMEQYGSEIWNAISRLPNGFCHGDLHSGNMFKTSQSKYVLFDFDIASNSYSIIDIATLSNATHFNRLDESAYDGTMIMLELLYQGYGKEKIITSDEIAAIFNFIAARHYELIATITECQGLQSLDKPFIDQQYEWLMQWRNICSRRL